MSVLSGLYAAGVAARNALYDRGTLPSRRLKTPVISVGNVAVGGAGKTPFVILLGELLARRGMRVAVLSRGYGRGTKGVQIVRTDDPATENPARRFGDEPLLIARKLGVPVVVGEDRYPAGLVAEKEFAPQMLLLDDGFQHRALARDFDIALVTPEDARDRVLPAGRLREPLSGLQRADVVVLSGGAKAEDFSFRDKKIWRVLRGIVPPPQMPARPVVFCGIARPQTFFAQLRKAGVEPAAEAAFRDHQHYGERELGELLAVHKQAEADGFITTEKDEINLGPLAARLQPLAVVPVRMKLEDTDAAIDHMLGVIAERRKSV